MKGQNLKQEVQFRMLVLLFNEESIALPTDLDFLAIFDRFEEIRFPGSCFFLVQLSVSAMLFMKQVVRIDRCFSHILRDMTINVIYISNYSFP